MAYTYKNFAYSTVLTAPSPALSGTSLVVQSGDGAKFSNGYAVCWPPSVQPSTTNAEIVLITLIATDTLTITRTQESSTAQSIAVGWQVDQGVTAGLLAQFAALSGATFTGPVAMSANKITGLTNGTAASDVAAFGQIPQVEAGKNFIINGGMDVWQRGTSFISVNYPNYTADRWQPDAVGGSTINILQVASGLTGFNYALRVQRPSGNVSTGAMYLSQTIETINSIPLQNQTLTLSFWARAGANFSSTSNLLNTQVVYGIGTDQNILSGMTGATTISNQNSTLTTSWQKFTFTFANASGATQIGLSFNYAGTGTAGTNDYFDITGVQLEVGSVATNFSRAGGSIGAELALCQRYYWQTGSAGLYGIGAPYSTTATTMLVNFPVVMRVTPTMTIGTIQPNTYVIPGVGVQTPTGMSTEGANGSSFIVHMTGLSGLTIGTPSSMQSTIVSASAEL